MIRNFNSDEIHSIQSLCRNDHFDVFCDFLDEHLGIAKEGLIDNNDEVMRGHAYCLRSLILKIKEAREFKPTEFQEPVINTNEAPGVNSFLYP